MAVRLPGWKTLSNWASSRRIEIRWPGWKTLLIWAFSILVPFGLENSSELMGYLSHECLGEQRGFAAKISAWYYGALEKLSPFEITANHVRLVTLNSAVEGDWVQNPCDSREFTGTLLKRIASIHPAAIVVDWSNAP